MVRLKKLNKIEQIDLLIVDDPPVGCNSLARFPALPVLYKLLSDKAIILIDDANRIGEQKIIELWLNKFDNLKVKRVDAEKGAVILQKENLKSPTYCDQELSQQLS